MVAIDPSMTSAKKFPIDACECATAAEPILAVHEIQGNSLAGFHKDYQMLLFLQITDVAIAKSWLSGLMPHIATMAEVLQFNRLFKATRQRRQGREGTVRSTFINIGFSYPGLRKLTPEADCFTDESFKAGLHQRSAALGDPTNPEAEGHPSRWLIGGSDNVPDIVLIVASDQRSCLDQEVKWLLKNLPKNGLQLQFKQRGETLPGTLAGHEHFGFKDGISQPGIRGRLSDADNDFLTPRENPHNPNQGKPGQDLLHAGEFIFGYPTQIGTPDPDNLDGLNIKPGEIADAGPSWAKNGSYLVFRRLRQDVPGFHAFLKATAAQLSQHSGFAGMTPEKLGAKLVGRWPSGAPIMSAPDRDDPALATDLDFEFDETDAKGFVCPFAAHIRKTYPRDTKRGPFINESATQTHRLLRRGIPYGKPILRGCPMRSLTSWQGIRDLCERLIIQVAKPFYPELGDRGLVFMAYQTSIQRQFEFVSGVWMNNPDFSDPDSGHDPILGQNPDGETRDRTMVIQAPGQNAKISLPTDWVIPTGGGYFFTPSMSALSYLTNGQ